MKSIVEEASSIAKALEKAWTRAGKPAQFSVKVFELPEKNFFGLTTKQAKVGIFFENIIEDTSKKNVSNTYHSKKSTQKPQQHASKREHTPSGDMDQRAKSQLNRNPNEGQGQQRRAPQQKTVAPRTEQPKQITRPPKQEKNHGEESNKEKVEKKTVTPQEPVVSVDAASVWTDEKISMVADIIKESLSMLGLPNIEFSQIVTEQGLRVTFSTPVLDNVLKEKQFFQHYAYIIIALLKNKFRGESQSMRLFLTSERGL